MDLHAARLSLVQRRPVPTTLRQALCAQTSAVFINLMCSTVRSLPHATWKLWYMGLHLPSLCVQSMLHLAPHFFSISQESTSDPEYRYLSRFQARSVGALAPAPVRVREDGSTFNVQLACKAELLIWCGSFLDLD
jgi:hypothetical protein